jgi:hypothetical protein
MTAKSKMTYPQSTLEEIIESERAMLLDAPARYGAHYKHARTVTMYLSLCVESIEHDRADMFGRLFSLLKKHHTLALFSALRLHKAQAMMNLRQVLEAGAAAAFAIANPEPHHFVNTDAFGILDPSQKLTGKRYKWMEKNYPDKSAWIKGVKDQINTDTAHANVISADRTFRVTDDGQTASAPFFDIEDEHFVKINLWNISRVPITLMDFFYGVAGDVAARGRSVVSFRPDLCQVVKGLAAENKTLQVEITNSDRYKTAMAKIAARKAAEGT